MNTTIKTIIVTAAAVLSAAACDKWTAQEPLEFDYVTIGEKNPALYEAYMQSIRDYRMSDHQVLIARFDNKGTVPSGRADHINCLPDSVDFVVLNNVDLINPRILGEADEIRTSKSIRTLIPIDYDAVLKDYNLYVEGLGEDGTPVSKEEWLSDKVGRFIAKADEYGVDGIMVCLEGRNPLGLNDVNKASEASCQEAFFAPLKKWLDGNASKLFFFQGNPVNIFVKDNILSRAAYIIVSAESVTTVVGLDNAVKKVCNKDVPTDRIIIGVTALDVTDETAVKGRFSGGISAIEGAGRWAVSPLAGVTKAGVCVNHAQFDYYNISNVYSEIGKAISTMNPSPLK